MLLSATRWFRRLLSGHGRALVSVLLIIVALVVYPAYATRDRLPVWLEEATGETDLRQQLEGLVLLVRQRPVRTEDMAPVRYAGLYPFGANTFFEQEVEEWKLRRSMELLRDAGVKWVRQEFPWNRIEVGAKGNFSSPQGSTWDTYDRIVALAQDYGLELVVRLDLTPDWAGSDASTLRSPPDDFEDYGDFVAAVASRYKGRVRYYQIWNEPNLFFEWGRTPDAAEYVRLLRTAYQRAKAIDPAIVILSAALAPTLGTPDGKNESDLTYLQKMYDAGAGPYFDVLSAQGYGLWTGPGDRRADPNQVNMSRVQLLREIMVRNGDSDKAVWISELGWDAVPPDLSEPPLHGRVTEEQQARYTVAALQRIQEEWPWAGVVFYWHFRKVSDEARRNEEFYFRMVDPDFTLRPVYFAVQSVAQQPPVLYGGGHQADHWALRYDGPWEARSHTPTGQPGAENYGATTRAGSRLRFTFKGSGVSLVTITGPDAGRLAVQIDGSSLRANRVMVRDAAGQAVLDLKAQGQEWGVRVPLAAGLEDTYHEVTLTALGDGEVAIGGVVVVAPQRSFQQLLVGVGLFIGAAVALGAALAVRRA